MIYTYINDGWAWVDGEMISKGNYYLEIVRPTLFDKGRIRLYKYAHPNSLSGNHLLECFDYEQIEEAKWEFDRITDPVETVYGDF